TACTATPDRPGGVAPDVLGLILLLGRVGVVRRVRIGLRDRELVRRARARGDVAAGHIHRHVGVDGVLLADRRRTGPLLGVGCLDADLRCTGSAAPDLAGRGVAYVLDRNSVVYGVGRARGV